MNERRVLAVVLCATTAAVFAAVALGNAGFGFTASNLVAKADFDETAKLNSDRIKFQTKDATDVRIQKVTYDPGGRSGWHHHPGLVIGVVESGELTVWDANCQTTTYGPGNPNGAVFLEYGDEAMQVGNTTGTPAVVYGAFIAPDATPPLFRIENDPPPCA